MTTSRPQPQLCTLKIGYETIVLPITKALKIVELLSGAVTVEYDFSERRQRYRVEGQVKTEFQSINAADLIMGEDAVAAPVFSVQKRLISGAAR